MYKLSQAALLLLRLVACVYFLLGTNMTYAGAGHDHGHAHEEPEVTSAAATTPRLTMESKQFELVGVLEGKKLHLYLDHYTNNMPITDASIELELAGKRLQAVTEANGRYYVTLKTALEEGVYPILATVVSQQGTDFLMGKLAIHHNDHSAQPEEKVSPLGLVTQSIHPSWIILMSLLVFFMLGFVLLRDRQKRVAA
jgi:hypothetical protein